MIQHDASLDTSFWNVATQIGITPYLFTFFRVYYCNAVEREIVATDPGQTTLIFPQAMLFMVFKEDGRLHHAEPKAPETLFGLGEAHAIALARENSWFLLINDYRPLQFARSLGIRSVSVPGLSVLLYAEGKITLSAVQGYLRRLAATSSPNLIKQAQRSVNFIAEERGEIS